LLTVDQGFDEFMNLVIDDAVEVKQATKAEGESRRELGKCPLSQEQEVNVADDQLQARYY
jgi:small nuclear ribonucleoprotein (snRNP)-like protein